MPAIPTWSDELLARTKALYESGNYSCRQISQALWGIKSRNAVIGIARRRGWKNPNPQKGGTKPGEKRPRTPRIRIWNVNSSKQQIQILAPLSHKQEVPAEVPKPDNFLGLTMQELADDQCRFPDGDGPYFFCGQPKQDGSSYCAYHHRVCWEKPARRPDRQFVSRHNF